jgi:hypothetical protein
VFKLSAFIVVEPKSNEDPHPKRRRRVIWSQREDGTPRRKITEVAGANGGCRSDPPALTPDVLLGIWNTWMKSGGEHLTEHFLLSKAELEFVRNCRGNANY